MSDGEEEWDAPPPPTLSDSDDAAEPAPERRSDVLDGSSGGTAGGARANTAAWAVAAARAAGAAQHCARVSDFEWLERAAKAPCPACKRPFKFYCYWCLKHVHPTRRRVVAGGLRDGDAATGSAPPAPPAGAGGADGAGGGDAASGADHADASGAGGAGGEAEAGTVPLISLPLNVHVLHEPNEKLSKSTAVHAKVVAPESVEFHEAPGDVPDYSLPEYAGSTVLLFPSPDAPLLEELPPERVAAIRTVVFVDSTWAKAGSVCRLPAVAALPCIRMGDQETLFWRFQQQGPECLATIEAIYHFCRLYATALLAPAPYDGRCDDLMYFFLANYAVVQGRYTADKSLTFTKRMRAGYIKYDEGDGDGDDGAGEAAGEAAASGGAAGDASGGGEAATER